MEYLNGGNCRPAGANNLFASYTAASGILEMNYSTLNAPGGQGGYCYWFKFTLIVNL